MKRYYNNTTVAIPYTVTDFHSYCKITSLRKGSYFSTEVWKSKSFAGFKGPDLVFIFRRKDFDKLSII